MQFITRAYNTIEFNNDLKTITKKSDEERLKDEISYYNSLPPSVSLYFPRVFRTKTDKLPFQFEMEYYSYNNLGHYYLNNSYDEKFWNSVFETLFSSINYFKKFKGTFDNEKVNEYCKSMFITKTIKEFDSLKNKFEYFNELTKHEFIFLNDKKYKNFLQIWDSLQEKVNLIISKQKNFNIIHGDMCFSNILYGYTDVSKYKTVKYVDPRGSFGEKGIYGSSLYDYAKLLHSIDGNYEAFIYDKFELLANDNNFQLKFAIPDNNNILANKCFKNLLNEEEYKDAKLIEGLIFIGMCARHYDSFERQKGMYVTGIRILNEVLNEDLC